MFYQYLGLILSKKSAELNQVAIKICKSVKNG